MVFVLVYMCAPVFSNVLLVGHVVCAVGLPRSFSIVGARLLPFARLAVINRLIASLFELIFLELVQMRLQTLLILQVVLQEDVFLGLRGYEGVLDR